MSLEEVENLGRVYVALGMMHGPCMADDGLSAIKMTLSSLSLAKTGDPSLVSSSLYQWSCTCCESLSYSLYIIPKC